MRHARREGHPDPGDREVAQPHGAVPRTLAVLAPQGPVDRRVHGVPVDRGRDRSLRDTAGALRRGADPRPGCVYGYFPVRPEGNDLVVLHEDGSEWVRWTFPRQPEGRKLAIPDFFHPDGDVLGVHARDDGIEGVGRSRSGCSRRTSTPTTCTCTGSASRWPRHSRSSGTRACARSSGSRATTRRRWTRSSSRATAGAGTRSGTRRVRTSRATSSCSSCSTPARIGVELSEEFQLVPEQSTSALIVHHPQAKYFTIMRSRDEADASLS